MFQYISLFFPILNNSQVHLDIEYLRGSCYIPFLFEFFIIFVLFTNNPVILLQFCSCDQILIPEFVQADWKNLYIVKTSKMAGLLVK